MAIDFSKYRIQPSKPKKGSTKPNTKHYKRMLRRLRKELPNLNG